MCTALISWNFSCCFASFRFVFILLCIVFVLAHFILYFSNRLLLLFHFSTISRMCILMFHSVSLHVILHITFDTYILALVHRMCVFIFWYFMQFVSSASGWLSFVLFYSFFSLYSSFIRSISLHINSFVKCSPCQESFSIRAKKTTATSKVTRIKYIEHTRTRTRIQLACILMCEQQKPKWKINWYMQLNIGTTNYIYQYVCGVHAFCYAFVLFCFSFTSSPFSIFILCSK